MRKRFLQCTHLILNIYRRFLYAISLKNTMYLATVLTNLGY